MHSIRRRFALVVVSALACSSAIADHDFFRNAQLPGERRPEVSLDRVTDEAPADGVPTGYQRRTVEWWPKKGVDVVKIPEGAPLRTWTINPDSESWWPLSLRGKESFKAHLLGFRGIGMDVNPFRVDSKGKPNESATPAVVLRLEDGRKRCFVRGSFSEADERYINELFEREMKELRDNTFEEGITRTVSPRHAAQFPKTAELYQPGTTIIETKHFAAMLGTEDPEDKRGSRWLIKNNKEQAAANRKAIMLGWENWWAYLEHAGSLMPYWEKPDEKYKYAVQIGGTKRDGTKVLGRGAGGGYGGMSGGNGNWWAMYHEWTHGMLSGGMISLGGGETVSDAAQVVGDPRNAHKMMFQVVKPWKNLFWGAYPGDYAWSVMGDDPNWGYAAANTIPPLLADGEHTPMHAIARLGKKRGIFKNGVRGMGDMMGQIGARMAEFDNEQQSGLRTTFTMPTRTALQAIDLEQRLYRSPLIDSPEPFGVNLIKLEPDPDAKSMTVDFQGHYDPATYSDWRTCIVAVDQEGRCRYSPLFNKGTMTMEIEPGDRRFWLTVTATPYALSSAQPDGAFTVWTIYQGGFAYAYPYDVSFKGCRPGSPHTTLEENDVLDHAGGNFGLVKGEGGRSAIVPATAGTPGYIKMKDALKDATGYIAEKHMANAEGAPHPNGGGWVSKDSTVDPSAYIAKGAMVLDGAQVLGNAVINDHAIVIGPRAVVKDNARVYGKVVITGPREYSGNARVYRRDEAKKEIVSQEPQVRTAQWRSGSSRFAGNGSTLQANYGCDVPETTLLEDLYREHSTDVFYYGAHRSDLISFSGVLRGTPGFEKLPQGGALTFNGVDQYGELPGEVADLEESTLAVRFKSTGAQDQTLFSFGTSAKDHFKLSVTHNKLAFVTVTGGNAQTLQGKTPLKKGEYHTCRIELDGAEIKLYLNDVLEADIASDYRPSQAFLPGTPRRGYLARGIEGQSFFAGAIDYFRIFTKVTDRVGTDEIPLVSSRKISGEFEARFTERFPDHSAQVSAAEAAAPSHPVTLFYQKYNMAIDSRLRALKSTKTPRVLELEEELKTANQELIQLKEAANSQKQNNADFAAKQKEAEKRLKPLKDQLKVLMEDSEYAAAKKEYKELRKKINGHKSKWIWGPGKEDPKYQSLKKAQKEFVARRKKASKSARKEMVNEGRSLSGALTGYVEAQIRKDPEVDKLYPLAHDAKIKLQKQKYKTYRSPEVKLLRSQIHAGTPTFKQDPAITEKIRESSALVSKLAGELAVEKNGAALAANPAELRALNFTAYFRKAYTRTIVKALLKEVPQPTEDIQQLKAAYRYQQAPWHTDADWDGRAAYEFNPASVKQPVMQMYLKKMKPWMYGEDK